MRPAHLAFTPTRGPAQWLGWGLLALALLALALLWRSGDATRAQLTQVQGRLWQLHGQHAQPVAPAASPAELQAGERLTGELGLRWDLLFATLEQAQTPGVELNLVHPDPVRRVLRLGGRARDTDALVAYLRHLQQGGTLRRAHLIQQAPDNGGLRFQLQADWTR